MITLRVARVVLFLLLPAISMADELRLGPNTLLPGKVLEFDAPLSSHAKLNVSRTRNPKVETAKGAIAVPETFDPKQTWPLLIISATSDGTASSIGAMKRFVPPALEAGWVIIAADGPAGKPADDSDAWRWAMLLGVLDLLHKEWPDSRKWPVACAGFSGGAKRSALIAALAMKAGRKVNGVFMAGCNQDAATVGLSLYQPGQHFRRVPIFLSSGTTDPIATPAQHTAVKQSMERSGFANVRLQTFEGGHQISSEHVKAALKWFRSWPSK